MEHLPELNQILLAVLLASAIIAIWRLYFVMGDARRTLGNVEQTRKEVTETLQRVEAVAASTDQAIREQVVPTLMVTRDTLANVEVMTRTLADTTVAARRLTGQVEAVMDSRKLLSLGGTIAQFAAKQSAGLAGSLLAGLGNSVRHLIQRRSDPVQPKAVKALPGGKPKSLPAKPSNGAEPATAGKRGRK